MFSEIHGKRLSGTFSCHVPGRLIDLMRSDNIIMADVCAKECKISVIDLHPIAKSLTGKEKKPYVSDPVIDTVPNYSCSSNWESLTGRKITCT